MTVCWSRSWRAKLAREASIARMKELDSYGLVDDSFSLADVVRNSTNERACRSVQSKSYDVMYCTAKSNRNDGRQLPKTFTVILPLFSQQ